MNKKQLDSKELKQKKTTELRLLISNLKYDLLRLRCKRVIGEEFKDSSVFKKTRKDIARLNTALNANKNKY